MNIKALVASAATILVALSGCTSVSAAPVPNATTPVSNATAPVASATPSASAPTSPSATATPSASVTPSTTPTPKPSATATDPTQDWGEPKDCTKEFPGFSHLAQCKVKGKTALQVFEACQAAARYFVWAQSGGIAGDAKDEISYEKFVSLSATCMQGSGMKVTGISNLNACPKGCKARDGKGLEYIFLRADVDGELTPALFNATTGQVLDSAKETAKLDLWVRQFEH